MKKAADATIEKENVQKIKKISFLDSGLNLRRRRRNAEGVLFARGARRHRRRAGYIPEVIRPNRTKPKRSYARFQERATNRVIVADFKLKAEL